MRELKFRAWSKKHNSYLKFRGIQYDDDKNAGVFVVYGTIAGIPNTICLEPEDVILEQYTGLKDENGKEIYEGDLVEYTTCYYGNEKRHRKVVEWKEWDSDDFGEPHNLGYSNLDECMKVISNVHENADLLEEICD